MIIVTGGFGMIGSNIVKRLNTLDHKDILVVDDLTDGTQFVNLADCDIADYIDKSDFLEKIRNNSKEYQKADVIFHLGACSSTTEWNGQFMLKNNYEYSKELLHFCMNHGIPFIYASSAAVYGGNETFSVSPEHEKPLNVYGYSKLLFDQYVRRYLNHTQSQIVGLRYFNVYGPREQHKGSMASVVFHANQQIKTHEIAKLFGEYDGYTAGEQQRDFVYVGDVAEVNIWFYEHCGQSGIYNVGTGEAATFNRLVEAVIQWHEKGRIEYVPFPEHLKTRYQSFTQADITPLRNAGYREKFFTVEQGVPRYLDWLNDKSTH